MALFNIIFKDKSNKITSADEAQKLMEEDILKDNISKILILEDQDVIYYADGTHSITDKELERKAIEQSEHKGITREQVRKQLQDQKDWDSKFLRKPGEKKPWDMNEAEEKDEKMDASDIELAYAYIRQLLTNKNIQSKMRYDNEVIQIYVDKNTSVKDIFNLIKSTKSLSDIKIEENDKDIGLVAKHKNIKIAIFNDESSKFAKDFGKRKEMDSSRLSKVWGFIEDTIDVDKAADSKTAVNWANRKAKELLRK